MGERMLVDNLWTPQLQHMQIAMASTAPAGHRSMTMMQQACRASRFTQLSGTNATVPNTWQSRTWTRAHTQLLLLLLAMVVVRTGTCVSKLKSHQFRKHSSKVCAAALAHCRRMSRGSHSWHMRHIQLACIRPPHLSACRSTAIAAHSRHGRTHQQAAAIAACVTAPTGRGSQGKARDISLCNSNLYGHLQ